MYSGRGRLLLAVVEAPLLDAEQRAACCRLKHVPVLTTREAALRLGGSDTAHRGTFERGTLWHRDSAFGKLVCTPAGGQPVIALIVVAQFRN